MNRYEQKIQELGGIFIDASIGKLPIALSEADLANVESDLSHSLPPDYREFLRDYGAYRFPECPALSFKNNDNIEGGVSMFYGVLPSPVYGLNLMTVYRNRCDSEWRLDVYSGLTLIRPLDKLEIVPFEEEESTFVKWPSELLPIGDSGGNDMVCLVIDGEQTGYIYYWINDPSFGESNVYYVANSFDEFMHLLEPRSGRV